MKKTILYILVLAVIIGLGIAVGLNLEDDKKVIPTTSEKTENKKTEDKVENKVQNKIDNALENKVENNTVGNVIEEELEENGPEDKNNEPKTDLQKAIDIVKKDWGEDNSVYFAQDGQNSKGEYIICVRENSTTNALAWYTVNVEKGTFEKW